jgi:two-component system, LytTR family, response regulator
MKIKTVLVDDEFHSTEILEDLIIKNLPQVEILAKFNEPEKALTFLKTNKVDLLFLDIEMPHLNGFELLEKLNEEASLPSVAFVTAYDQYALKAFKYSAFNYLLKPVEKEDIIQLVSQFEQRNKHQPDEQLQYLISLFRKQNNFEKLVLSVQDGFEIIQVNDIIHIDSDSNYSTLYIENNKTIVIARTLKDFESTLKEKGFLRVHHSHLVNLSKITKFIKADGGYVLMSNGNKINVSKSKKEDLIKFFESI